MSRACAEAYALDPSYRHFQGRIAESAAISHAHADAYAGEDINFTLPARVSQLMLAGCSLREIQILRTWIA